MFARSGIARAELAYGSRCRLNPGCAGYGRRGREAPGLDPGCAGYLANQRLRNLLNLGLSVTRPANPPHNQLKPGLELNAVEPAESKGRQIVAAGPSTRAALRAALSIGP